MRDDVRKLIQEALEATIEESKGRDLAPNQNTSKLYQNHGQQERLEQELERLKRILKLGYELKVRWIPNDDSKLSGEVKGEIIYIYERNGDLAMETLKHELIDYTISKVIEPYGEVTNRLIALINDDAYRRKERLADTIALLM